MYNIGRILLATATVSNGTAVAHSELHQEPFTYYELLSVLAFLSATWAVGWCFRYIGFPELLGNVIMGVVLGPEVVDLCGKFNAALMLVGEVGFLLMMLEGGLEVDVPMLLQLGHRGLGVALLGQGISIGLSMAVMQSFNLDTKAAFATGAVFAPMSTSVLLAIFKQFEMLNTPTGQLCLVAAVFDDIFGLIMLSELKAVKEGGVKNIVIPLVTSLAWLAVVGFFGIKYFPNLVKKHVLHRVPRKHREGFLLATCFLVAVALGTALFETYASRYLGVFLAGLMYCSIHTVHEKVWGDQVKRIHRWLLRVFFAATVAFEIPIRSFGARKVWIKAASLLLPLFGKCIVGIFAPSPFKEEFWKVGVAMMSRGEMSFVINRMARAQLQLIDKETGAAIMLVVVLAIFIVPIMLTLTLKHFAKKRERELQERVKKASTDPVGTTYYRVVLKTPHTFGLLDRSVHIFHMLSHEVMDFRMEYEDEFTILEAYLIDNRSAELTTEALRQGRVKMIRDHLRELLSHDRGSIEGTDLITKQFEEMMVEAGGKASHILKTATQDDVFEKAGKGVMVQVWAPWLDDGFLCRNTYHPLKMNELDEGRPSANGWRKSSNPSMQPKQMNAAEVLRLARKSLVESRAFRASFSAVGATTSSMGGDSFRNGSLYATGMASGDGANGDGNGNGHEKSSMTGHIHYHRASLHKVSMHLQHANTMKEAHEGGEPQRKHEGHMGYGAAAQITDEELLKKLPAALGGMGAEDSPHGRARGGSPVPARAPGGGIERPSGPPALNRRSGVMFSVPEASGPSRSGASRTGSGPGRLGRPSVAPPLDTSSLQPEAGGTFTSPTPARAARVSTTVPPEPPASNKDTSATNAKPKK